MEPAKSIIEMCGGYAAVAEMVSLTEIQVRKWTYPKDRGGTDGLIPANRQIVLLEAAEGKGVPLTPAHFFRKAS